MSHVDDGTLHAYLDGELSALESVRVEAHAHECAACRARLADERGLIARASELLEQAVPAERPAPPLRMRARLPRWRAPWSLAAAASVVLALAVGWGVGTRPRFRLGNAPGTAVIADERKGAPRATERDATPAVPPAAPTELAQVEAPPPAPEPAQPAERRARDVIPDAAADATPATGNASPATIDRAAVATDPAVDRPEAPTPPSAALAGRAESKAVEGLTVRAGGDVLGAELLGVPGLPVRSVRRARQTGFASVVLVEQQLDSARTIQIVHRRGASTSVTREAGELPREERIRPEGETHSADSAASGPGGLDIEVTGALPADSLAALRRALRPLPR